MTTTWNNTSPAVGNQISADIPDILENFQHLKTGFVRIFQTAWSDSDLSAHVCDSAVGWSDGTYTYDFPTNQIAANATIMLGDADTVAWFYLNAAPPGWKVQATGADTVLAISGGSSSYNANGGTAGGDWTTTHTHSTPNHTHTTGTASANTVTVQSGGAPTETPTSTAHSHSISSSGGSTSGTANFASHRPSASIGKLFKLDEA